MPTATEIPTTIMEVSKVIGPDTSMLMPDTMVIITRMIIAMLLGALVGIEREYTHRPAGMRTHMLVCLGSAAVMLTSQMIFAQYRPYGTNPDPARLSAQVITGVGFLGAGTILKEGPTVKGLTTAASVWTTACLGIAVGAGYYVVGLIGTACMLVTLIFFERLQVRLMKNSHGRFLYTVICDDIAPALETVDRLAKEHEATVTVSGVTTGFDNRRQLSFTVRFGGKESREHSRSFLGALSSVLTVSRMEEESSHGVPSERRKTRGKTGAA